MSGNAEASADEEMGRFCKMSCFPRPEGVGRYPAVSDGAARIALFVHQQLSAHGGIDHCVLQRQLYQGHLEERFVRSGKLQVPVCHQGCVSHHLQYHRL